MRQDKDRTAKWLLAHHGDAVLRLAGFTDFTSCRAVAAELVAPRRLPDGLLEVTVTGRPEQHLVLVEIESYPGKDVDPQVLDDLLLIAVDRNQLPDVVSIVLHPKGQQTVSGAVDRTSRRGTTRLTASWPVVRVWELEAADLLAIGDPGLIPWVPLAKTDRPPAELLTECRDRLSTVADPRDRAGLMAVTAILSGLAYPGLNVLALLGGSGAMIESPVLDELKEAIRAKIEAEGKAEGIVATLRSATLAVLALQRTVRFPLAFR